MLLNQIAKAVSRYNKQIIKKKKKKESITCLIQKYVKDLKWFVLIILQIGQSLRKCYFMYSFTPLS